MSLETTMGPLLCPKIAGSLVHKRREQDQSFCPPSKNSAFCFIARFRTRSSMKERSIALTNYLQFWVILQKMGEGQTLYTFRRLPMTPILNGEHLRKETCYRQPKNGIENYEGSPTGSQNS